ncbi:hypothetical protein BU17DRAFT_89875 [Hysterangium stoloniferum]|nr:hypothetical protein BU17DRAFT_89875 [Hysterangium stoloniferum]
MFGRFLQPLPLGVTRRTYSIFSSKPGGGRYFNSAKPHKVAPTAASPSASTKDSTTTPSPSATTTPTTTADNTPTPEETLGQEDGSVVPPAPAVLAVSAPTPRLPPHPTFSAHTYPLHQFFAFHRPLLHLSQPTSAIFESPKEAFDELPPPQEATTSSLGEASEVSADADADAARQLARALAVNRLGGWIDWEEVLAKLGDSDSKHAAQIPLSSFGVNMDSTKRKRRKKMSKHKFKKRRRLQRSARQKMGK